MSEFLRGLGLGGLGLYPPALGFQPLGFQQQLLAQNSRCIHMLQCSICEKERIEMIKRANDLQNERLEKNKKYMNWFNARGWRQGVPMPR